MQERIKQAFESTKRIALHHYESLLQERPTGSQWGYNPTEEDLTSNGFELQELSGPHISPHCTYYKQNLDEHTLSFQMAESSEVVSESSIHAKTGVHGWELISGEVGRSQAREAWIILGPEDGEEIVFTAFPGKLLKPLPEDFNGDIDTIDLSEGYAVKGF